MSPDANAARTGGPIARFRTAGAELRSRLAVHDAVSTSDGHSFSEDDLAYMRSLSAAVVQRSPRYLLVALAASTAFLLAMLVWMGWAELDIVVRGDGKVIPSQQVQLIQSLEGGVVSEILVREGDAVSEGQPLMKISDIPFAGSFEENRLHQLELQVRIARLQAEAYGTPFAEVAEAAERVPSLLQSEKSLHQTNIQQLNQTVQILEQQLSQARNDLVSAEAKEKQLAKSYEFISQELAIKKPLVAKRLVSELDYLQLQRQANEVEGELQTVRISIPGIRSRIEEAQSKLEQGRLDFQNKAKRELNEALAEASRIAETQAALRDRVRRTLMRSPVNGTVKRLHVNTIGGVIKPGSEAVEIVPSEDALLVEVRIKPADIADIDVGQKARIKFSAYDFAIYGSLEGELRFVGADTVTDEKGNTFYVARLKPVRSYIGPESRPLPIKVGMTSSVDILTGKKTILEYLLKPVYRATANALGER